MFTLRAVRLIRALSLRNFTVYIYMARMFVLQANYWDTIENYEFCYFFSTENKPRY